MFAFALLVAAAVLLNLMSGAVLTNTLTQGAGNALGGLFSLLGHRHVSEGVGTLVLILALWITFADKRVRVKVMAWVGVACVAAEAILGRSGAPLSPGIAFLHAFVSQILFALLVHIVIYEWPGWERVPQPIVDRGWPSLRGLSNATVGALLLQVTLGAAFRHNLLSVLWHILCAFVVVILGLGMLVLITQVPENRSLRAPVIWLGSLLGVQVTLGMVLISISDAAKHALFSDITVALHVTVGTTCLGLGVLTSMLIRRAAKAAPAEVPAES